MLSMRSVVAVWWFQKHSQHVNAISEESLALCQYRIVGTDTDATEIPVLSHWDTDIISLDSIYNS